MYYYGFDLWYFVLVLPAVLLALLAGGAVKSTFNKYAKVTSASGMTGAEMAQRVLAQNGVYGVRIEQVSGDLSDHFDPKANVIRLSERVYGARSVAALGVAAHEAGHAVQYAENYAPMKLRAAIIPMTNIGSNLSMPLILLGLILSLPTLAYLGVFAFGLSTLFQLITLPVEFNASHRAVRAMTDGRRLSDEDIAGTKKVLTAAALTYVASLAVSLANLLRLYLIVSGGKSRRR